MLPAWEPTDDPQSVPPLESWYAGDAHVKPAPFDLKAQLVDATNPDRVLKTVAKGQPFHLKVEAEKNLHFVLLHIRSNRAVELRETKQNGELPPGSTLLEAKSPAGGTGPFMSQSRVHRAERDPADYFVLLAAEAPQQIPPVVLVRSHHAVYVDDKQDHYPVYRFLFDPADPKSAALDRTKVVRKVIPVPINVKGG